MKKVFMWLLAFTLLFAGCGKKTSEESPPPLETGIAAENASDFAVIGGELWVIEEGEAHAAGETPENKTDNDTESPDVPPSAEAAPDMEAAGIAFQLFRALQPHLFLNLIVALYDEDLRLSEK